MGNLITYLLMLCMSAWKRIRLEVEQLLRHEQKDSIHCCSFHLVLCKGAATSQSIAADQTLLVQADDPAVLANCTVGASIVTAGQPSSEGSLVSDQDEGSRLEAKKQICFDFTKGTCTRGEACKFSHDIKRIIEVNSQEQGICFDFLRGACSRGAMCRFSHDLSNFDPQDGQVGVMHRSALHPFRA